MEAKASEADALRAARVKLQGMLSIFEPVLTDSQISGTPDIRGCRSANFERSTIRKHPPGD